MLLAIDTAGPACSVALLDGDSIVAERHEIVGRGHAERLVPMIEALLEGQRPDSILVDCGPGSFTGVRIGIAAAQGLSIGWNVPVKGYSSLALLAASVQEADVAAALQGGHGQFFVQSYGGDPFAATDDLRSLPPTEAGSAIRARIVVGTAAAELVAVRGHGVAVERVPRAADARLLPSALLELAPRPIYGRGPDARPIG